MSTNKLDVHSTSNQQNRDLSEGKILHNLKDKSIEKAKHSFLDKFRRKSVFDKDRSSYIHIQEVSRRFI